MRRWRVPAFIDQDGSAEQNDLLTVLIETRRSYGDDPGMYYFVPGMLQHFDTEAIFALVAPRPMLQLSGDQDGGAPTDGIEVLEEKLGALYRLYGQPGNFRSVIYKDTGHEYLPEMKAETIAWFARYLPPSP